MVVFIYKLNVQLSQRAFCALDRLDVPIPIAINSSKCSKSGISSQILYFQSKFCIQSNFVFYPIFVSKSKSCVFRQGECFLQTVILCNKSIMEGANSDSYYTTHYQSAVSPFLFRCKMQLEKQDVEQKASKRTEEFSWRAGAVYAKLHDALRDVLLSFQLYKLLFNHKMHCVIFKDNKLSQPHCQSYQKEGACSIKHHLTLYSCPLRSSLMSCWHQLWQHIHFCLQGLTQENLA